MCVRACVRALAQMESKTHSAVSSVAVNASSGRTPTSKLIAILRKHFNLATKISYHSEIRSAETPSNRQKLEKQFKVKFS
jgi:hypothetical protein